ncbi:MAG: hypothetical protein EA423_07135 [Phycisphaerales bacterium]|nr:MAG: hypothetical protein EA423_07135 [Phycisphaerales bacterium]
MAINMQRARTLCTASEYELVRASGKREIGTLTPARLRQKVARARKLRDKFRSLAARQTGEMRGKRAPRSGKPAGDNRNTEAKAELFQETLDRFEEALAKTGETPTAPPAHKKVTRRRSNTADGATAAPATKKTSKKTSKKVRKKASKKTAKKAKKKAARKKSSARKGTGAAALLSSAGGMGKKASRKKVAKRALPGRNPLKSEPAPQAAVESGRKKTSKRSRGARKDKHFAESGIAKNVRGVAGKTRRNQAKRDSRG